VFCFEEPEGGCLAAGGNTAYAGGVVGEQPVLFVAADGGRTWQPRWWGRPGDHAPRALHLIDEKRGIMLVADGTLLRTWDGCSTWLPVGAIPLDASDDATGMSWADERVGYVVGRGGLVLTTRDSGRSWQRCRVSAVHDLNTVLAISSEDAWVVGNAGTVLRTDNGGSNWERLELGIGEDLRSIAWNSRAIWMVGDGSVWILPPEDGSPLVPEPKAEPPPRSPFDNKVR
jgi:photosystem II stability/assembly factor-like uncharacterized protein